MHVRPIPSCARPLTAPTRRGESPAEWTRRDDPPHPRTHGHATGSPSGQPECSRTLGPGDLRGGALRRICQFRPVGILAARLSSAVRSAVRHVALADCRPGTQRPDLGGRAGLWLGGTDDAGLPHDTNRRDVAWRAPTRDTRCPGTDAAEPLGAGPGTLLAHRPALAALLDLDAAALPPPGHERTGPRAHPRQRWPDSRDAHRFGDQGGLPGCGA